VKPTRRRKPKLVPESKLQGWVRQCAVARGWLHYHTHNSRRSEAGFPDSVMVRGSRIVFAELKRQDKKPTLEQRAWLDALAAAGMVETYVWRPSDWDDGTIQEVLK